MQEKIAFVPDNVGKLITAPIAEEVKQSYLEYAMSVIVSRALPDVRDGFKPVHRRILYAMWDIGLKHTAKFRKSAHVVGEVMAKYHPHGDAAIYDSMVRMAQDFSMRQAFVDGQGNFGCFTADTKVKLTDGRDLSFAELIEENKQGKKNFTFTVNEKGLIEIAEIKKPRLTRKNAKIMEVRLDNGEKIKCTLNHKFMLKNGSYTEAADLKTGDSLMPGYFRLSTKKDDPNAIGYSMVYQPKEDLWRFVHVLSDAWNLEQNIYTTTAGKIRHHVNFNKLNNNPDNILRMQWADHWKTHYDYTSQKHKNDPAYRKKLADGRKLFWSKPENRQAYSERMSKKNASNWKDEEYRKNKSQSLSEPNKRYLANHPEVIKKISERASATFKKLWRIPAYKELFHNKIINSNKNRKTNQTGKKKFIKICSLLSTRNQTITRENYEQLRTAVLGKKSYTGWNLGFSKYFNNNINDVLCELNKNHKVAKITLINESTDVYDLTVEKSHNFLLSAGIFVHNSMDGDPAAAMRYTEAKLTSLAEEMLFDIEKNTVNFIPTYDGSHNEPTVVPSKVPNLLLNGTVGIAVGMSTSIAPHNLSELCDGVCLLIDRPKSTVEDLSEIIKGPDFPTGGIIYNKKDIAAMYATGRGGIVVRAKAEIVENKAGHFQIIVNEVPYQVNKATLLEKIAELVQEKKIEGIRDLRDESNKDGVRVVVDLKKDSYPKKILNQLFKMTELQTTFHSNMLALVDGIQPRILNLKSILEEFIKHRREVIRRRTEFDLEKNKERAHILEGLSMALDKIDLVIKTIRASKDKDEAKINLIKKFKFTDRQATAILEMRLQQLANLERQKIENELKEKKALIKELEAILASEARILKIIRTETEEIKTKYGQPRRTSIVAHGIKEFTVEDLVPNETTMIMTTTDGYVKRLPPDTFHQQSRGGKGVIGVTTKEEESVDQLQMTNTHDNVLFFTNRGRVFQLFAYDIPQGSRTAKGQALVNFLQLAPNEKVTALLTMGNLAEIKYLMMVTKKGLIKKTALEDFSNVRRSGLIALKLKGEDSMEWVKPSTGHDEVSIITLKGQAIRFEEGDVRPMGRNAAGVRGMRLHDKDEVISMDIVDPKNKNLELLTVGENGVGKRTTLSQYKVQGRGGSGIKTAEITAKTGNLIHARLVDGSKGDKYDLLLMSAKGQVIRLPLKAVSVSGRATQGVRLMRFKEPNDRVANVTVIENSETPIV